MASVQETGSYSIPIEYADLSEVACPPPDGSSNEEEKRSHGHDLLEDNSHVENPQEHIYSHHSLEEGRDTEGGYIRDEGAAAVNSSSHTGDVERPAIALQNEEPSLCDINEKITRYQRTSKLFTQLYTISYLILLSILGTLARLGLQSLTTYSGAPLISSEVWANFGGSLIMGFLSEDKMLFREEWGAIENGNADREKVHTSANSAEDEENSAEASKNTNDGQGPEVNLAAARKDHATVKKAIPLFIGLATGFCGSFTSFSSFIRDIFLACSNDLGTQIYNTSSSTRAAGYNFMAAIAVIIVEVSLCVSALHIGVHMAIALEPIIPTIPSLVARKILDPSAVVLAWGSWIGAICLAIWPPDRINGPAADAQAQETWRGQVLFALVFAPIGCLLRFYASLHLNGRVSSFPLGTFAVNIFGTAVLGMCWDLQHAPLDSTGAIMGGVIGCQVLQGVQDGFCGCVTTVSTWVMELTSLRRKHAYFYGTMSVGVALAILAVIMGSLRWTQGYGQTAC